MTENSVETITCIHNILPPPVPILVEVADDASRGHGTNRADPHRRGPLRAQPQHSSRSAHVRQPHSVHGCAGGATICTGCARSRRRSGAPWRRGRPGTRRCCTSRRLSTSGCSSPVPHGALSRRTRSAMLRTPFGAVDRLQSSVPSSVR